MGWFFWASFYPKEEVSLESFLEKVKEAFPQRLLEEDEDYPDSRDRLNLRVNEGYGCVHMNMPKTIHGENEDFRSWLGKLIGEFKVAYLVQGENTGGNGEVKVYVPKGHPLQVVEHRKGIIGSYDGKNRLYAFKRFQKYQGADKSRDHLDELESHYGGRPYYYWT